MTVMKKLTLAVVDLLLCLELVSASTRGASSRRMQDQLNTPQRQLRAMTQLGRGPDAKGGGNTLIGGDMKENPYPSIECDSVVENVDQYAICQEFECCDGRTTGECNQFAKEYPGGLLGSICWWCCSAQLLPKEKAPSPEQIQDSPTQAPTRIPSKAPTMVPVIPTASPTPGPTKAPVEGPVDCDSLTWPTQQVGEVTYHPGEFASGAKSCDGRVFLSDGLAAKPVAVAGQRVQLRDGSTSDHIFHIQPDGAAIFPNEATGGWFYTSNAEMNITGTAWNNGGVGSIEFDAEGHVVGYKRIASNTKMNCGGGHTPWNSWITCEETDWGEIIQTDPKGNKAKVATALGNHGWYESFAYDDLTDVPTFYVTRDSDKGYLTRFTPNAAGMECYRKTEDYERWCTLDNGTQDFLNITGGPSGTFTWITDKRAAEANAQFYSNAEGIDVADGKLYMTSKKLKRLVILDLRKQTYTYHDTQSGAFNHQPDQIRSLVHDDDILYFCEDGGRDCGIHGRNDRGQFFTIAYGATDTEEEETTGLAWSEDGKHMYVAYQELGTIYDIWRRDGRPFGGRTLDIKYHATS